MATCNSYLLQKDQSIILHDNRQNDVEQISCFHISVKRFSSKP